MNEEGLGKFLVVLLQDPEKKYVSLRANLLAPDGTRGMIYERITPGMSFCGYTFEELMTMGQGAVELEVRMEGDEDLADEQQKRTADAN